MDHYLYWVVVVVVDLLWILYPYLVVVVVVDHPWIRHPYLAAAVVDPLLHPDQGEVVVDLLWIHYPYQGVAGDRLLCPGPGVVVDLLWIQHLILLKSVISQICPVEVADPVLQVEAVEDSLDL